MHTVAILNRLIEHHETLAYVLIFLGLVFEGEITLISAGVLAHLGALDWEPTILVVLGGALLKTLLGYSFGWYLQKNYSHSRFLKYIEKRVLYFIPRFGQKPFWSIFISKFIMGANYMVVIFSGYRKVDLDTYLRAELLSTFTWAPLLLGVGYFFSYAALHFTREVGRFLLVVIFFTLLFLILDKMMSWLYEVFEHYENT